MNLLYANDRPGTYPASWYAATTDLPESAPPLTGKTRADVCIIGAGYTGLSAALHLAQTGANVIILEAQRIGFGASGRNGGQLGSGQRVEQTTLEKRHGKEVARHLWELGEASKRLVKDLIAAHGIDCDLKPGIAWTAESKKDADDLVRYAAHLTRAYDYDAVAPLDADACAALIGSPRYKGGLIDRGAGHLHPLRYALGLASAARQAGAIIHERSPVHHIKPGTRVLIQTNGGHVEADRLIIACNGYLGTLNRKIAARVMPINNFIIATEPLGQRGAEVLAEDIAVADSRFVINYFRLSHDGRLLFGGGESYGYKFPRDIAAKVRKPMLEIFPHLADVKVDYAWGGTLGITRSRMPYLSRLGPRILTASGYSGHGIGTATLGGKLLAGAVAGDDAGFDLFAGLPGRAFPGAGALRTPMLAMAMSWYAMRDRLGV